MPKATRGSFIFSTELDTFCASNPETSGGYQPGISSEMLERAMINSGP